MLIKHTHTHITPTTDTFQPQLPSSTDNMPIRVISIKSINGRAKTPRTIDSYRRLRSNWSQSLSLGKPPPTPFHALKCIARPTRGRFVYKIRYNTLQDQDHRPVMRLVKCKHTTSARRAQGQFDRWDLECVEIFNQLCHNVVEKRIQIRAGRCRSACNRAVHLNRYALRVRVNKCSECFGVKQ